MGCSGRKKVDDIRADQKWDFISLNDFKSTSCLTPFAYVYLIGSLIVSIAVYGVDTFTAVNLLVFDRWSGTIEPAIPLNISKWIFSACIIASWVNLGYEYFRAIRVMKRGAVAESYLDPLAVRLQCIRWTNVGKGWRRFLVFAELTKSKKGAEYVALFTYFSFQSWIRIIFCQGPRQVVNALTLYAVFQAELLPDHVDNAGSAIGEFFKKIGVLADQQHQQAVILCGMLFTLVIWVFGALSLILAVLFFLTFLWHYIPNADGGLTGYCENKTNKRLAAIVSVKVNKAIEEEERRRRKADAKAVKKGEKPVFGRQATLPTLFDPKIEDKLPQMPMLNRNDTTATLPIYSSRPGTPGGSGQPSLPGFELNQLDSKRPGTSRSATASSFGSNAPLMSNASEMGYGRSQSPAPSLPPLDRNGFPLSRSTTTDSQNSQYRGVPRMQSAMGDRGYTASPMSYDKPTLSLHMSNDSQNSVDTFGRPLMRGGDVRSNTPVGPPGRPPFASNQPAGRSSPYGSADYGRNSPAPSRSQGSDYGRSTPASGPPGVYQAYNPGARSASSASSAYNPASASQQSRGPPQGAVDYFGNGVAPPRPGTSHGGQPSITRLASPGAYNGRDSPASFRPNDLQQDPYRRS